MARTMPALTGIRGVAALWVILYHYAITAYDQGFRRSTGTDLATKFDSPLHLATRNPDKVQELKSLYEAWAQRCGVQPWPLAKPGQQQEKKKQKKKKS